MGDRYRWSDSNDPDDRPDWADRDGRVNLPPGVTRAMQLYDADQQTSVLVAFEYEEGPHEHTGDTPDPETAALILRALNCHDAMVAVAHEYVAELERRWLVEGDCVRNPPPETVKLRSRALAVLMLIEDATGVVDDTLDH